MKLRPYQKKAIKKITQALDEGVRLLVYAPTGAGKTEIARRVFAKIDGLKLFVVHTNVLRSQSHARLHEVGVFVTTIQQMLLNPDHFKDAAAICFDEAHHLQGAYWRNAIELCPGAGIFGLSATPFPGVLEQLFDQRYDAATIEQGVDEKWCVPITILRADPEKIRQIDGRIDSVHAYCKLTPGKQAIHFELTKADCELVAERYRAAGVTAEVITEDTTTTARELHIKRFSAKELLVLVSCNMLTEGFDAPCAEVVVAGRAFGEDMLTHQAAGRIRRAYPGKERAFFLDCSPEGRCTKNKDQFYFNTTDKELFCALPDAERGSGEGGAGPREPRTVKPIKWIQVEDWITETPNISELLQRSEYRDMFEAQQAAVTKLQKVVDAAARAAKREAERKRLQDPIKREAHLSYNREAQRKRMQDPVKRAAVNEAKREAKRKRMQDPVKRAAVNEAKREAKREAYPEQMRDPAKRTARNEAQREAHLKRMQDPVKREAKREYLRQRRQDPAAREAYLKRMQDPAKRATKREANRKRRQDPAVREADNEAKRKRRAAKKLTTLSQQKDPKK